MNEPLRAALVVVAGQADDNPAVTMWLARIAQQAAGLIEAVAFASVTAFRDGAPSTVALSSDVALALDEAQYTDGAGPCISALHLGVPLGLPDIGATVQWPRFREAAATFGLHTSLSIPLCAGQGLPIAALNLFSYDRHALDALTNAVIAVFGSSDGAGTADDLSVLDAGGRQLVTGLTEAMTIQAHLQRAMSALMDTMELPTDLAYAELCRLSTITGVSLYETATQVLADVGRSKPGQSDAGASS